MILKSLRLRGATGIKNGLGKEDVTVDFSQFAPGLIAIVGPNGAGKTTLIENLTPYRMLKSRPGGLARQFYLKDSCRDLLVGMNGDEYRFLININGVSAKLESYVYKNGEALNPDGKEATYTEIVTRLIGEPALFFASLFMPQHRSRFSDLAPADSKILLLKLIGADRLQAKCDYAGAQGKSLSDSIAAIEYWLKVHQEHMDGFADLELHIGASEKALVSSIARRDELAGQIRDIEESIRKYQETVTAQAVTESKLQQARSRLNDLLRDKALADVAGRKKIDELRTILFGDQNSLDRLNAAHTPERLQALDARVAEAEKVKIEYLATVETSRRHSELGSKLARAREQYATAKGKHDAEAARLKVTHAEAVRAYGEAEQRNKTQIVRQEEAIARTRRSIEILSTVPCQTGAPELAASCESCQFLKDAVEAKERVTDAVMTLGSLRATAEDELRDLSSELAAAREAHASFGEWIGSTDEVALRNDGERIKADIEAMHFDAAVADRLRTLHEALEWENPSKLRTEWDTTTREIEALTVRVNETSRRLDEAKAEQTDKLVELDKQYNSLLSEAQGLECSIDPNAAGGLADAKKRLEIKRAEDKSLGEDIARLQAELTGLQADREKRAKMVAEEEAKRAELATLQSDQADWNHLAQSLSRNGGFQSILVESAGAEMSPYADTMLALYGRSWTMEFATVRPSDDGKKMIEGFYVTINTPDGPRELNALSGGEEVIADQVIYDAIGNMLRRRSGLDLRTAIKDEADGALDSQRAIDYLRAVEAGHQASGLHHTIIISHRPELQEMIPQRIRLVPGTGIVTEVG